MIPEQEELRKKRHRHSTRGVTARLMRYIATLVGVASARPSAATPTYRHGAPTVAATAALPLTSFCPKQVYHSLRACAMAPEKFHDLAAVLGIEKQNELLSFVEALRAKDLITLYIKRNTLYTKINKKGIRYLKTLESEL